MPSFAERYGYRESRSVIQADNLDDETRISLWNLQVILRRATRRNTDQSLRQFRERMWNQLFQGALDELPRDGDFWDYHIKNLFYSDEWVAVIDFIEQEVEILRSSQLVNAGSMADNLVKAHNGVFEKYLVGYRFVGDEIAPLDSKAEVDALNSAITDTAALPGARTHLDRAIDHLADRQNPDYPNSIKESISAVESVCRSITGEKTLGAAVKKLEGAGVTVHPALRDAWSKMYGWTSDANGIRHGGIDAAEADQALAKYVLVTCSAFVSYVLETGRNAGIAPSGQ